MIGGGTADRVGWRRRRWIAFAVPTVMVAAVVAGFGCAVEEPPFVPTEPFEAVDLLAAFDDAEVSRIENGDREAAASPLPFTNPEREVLFVPLGAALEYELEVPPGSVFQSNDTRNTGSATGRLEISWAPAGGAANLLTRDLSAAPRRSACFGNTRSEKGRLLIRARGGAADDDPRAGLRIFNPRVIGGVGCEPGQVAEPPRDDRRRPNIVVYLIDALRADRLGCYGSDLGATPHIDEFASSALVFTGAQAQTSWTRPAVASIFTGLLPQQHGAIDKKDVLPESATTIAELLSGAGYESAAVVSNGNVSQVYGFSQGFSYYKYLQEIEIGEHVVRSEDVNKAVFSWFDEVRGEDPFFLYIHTVDPHLPYEPPDAIKQRFAAGVTDPSLGSVKSVNQIAADRDGVTPKIIEDLSNLYDGEVAANDETFGELMAGLEQRGLVENSVIVVLSDHGEEFFDHRGWTHGNTLHAEMLDVPLIIRVPGVAPGEIPEIVQHVDLFSTLLDLAGVAARPGVFGTSARTLWDGNQSLEWVDRGVSHLQIKERFGEAWVDPRFKVLTRRLGNGEIRTSLYDRVEDPSEHVDLADRQSERVKELLNRYREELAAAGASLEGVEIDAEREAEVEAQLRALGYL